MTTLDIRKDKQKCGRNCHTLEYIPKSAFCDVGSRLS